MRFALISTITGLIAADAIPSNMIDPVAKLGSTVVLAAILIWIITRTLPAKDKEFTTTVREIAKQQHDDSVQLNSTLTEMRSTCAVVQASLKREN